MNFKAGNASINLNGINSAKGPKGVNKNIDFKIQQYEDEIDYNTVMTSAEGIELGYETPGYWEKINRKTAAKAIAELSSWFLAGFMGIPEGSAKNISFAIRGLVSGKIIGEGSPDGAEFIKTTSKDIAKNLAKKSTKKVEETVFRKMFKVPEQKKPSDVIDDIMKKSTRRADKAARQAKKYKAYQKTPGRPANKIEMFSKLEAEKKAIKRSYQKQIFNTSVKNLGVQAASATVLNIGANIGFDLLFNMIEYGADKGFEKTIENLPKSVYKGAVTTVFSLAGNAVATVPIIGKPLKIALAAAGVWVADVTVDLYETDLGLYSAAGAMVVGAVVGGAVAIALLSNPVGWATLVVGAAIIVGAAVCAGIVWVVEKIIVNLDNICDTVANAYNACIDFAGELIDSAVETLDNIVEGAIEIVEDFGNAVVDFAEDVGDVIEAAAEEVGEFFSDLGEALFSW